MARDLVDAFPVARQTFAEADECLDAPLSRLCFEGPEETLALTEHAQPAILTASVAAFRVLRETAGLAPVALAGHSLGEWSALVTAGAMRFADAVRGVRERGRLMQAAVPVGVGAMAAVMGLEGADVAALCAEATTPEGLVTPANLNGGGQVVVAGHTAAVDRLLALAATRRARSIRLAVSAPFHCALMAPAAEGLAPLLRTFAWRAPEIPVVTSVEARRVRDGAEIPDLLVRQLTAPVRWEETVHALGAFAPDLGLEVGPGQTLCGLMRRIVPELVTIAAGDVPGVAKATEALT